MFGFEGSFGVEEIKSEGIEFGVDFLEEAVAEGDPFFLSDLAFEDGFLDADAVVGAGSCDAAEAACSGFIGGGDVVGDEDEHGAEGGERLVIWG